MKEFSLKEHKQKNNQTADSDLRTCLTRLLINSNVSLKEPSVSDSESFSEFQGLADLRIRGFHLTVGRRMMSLSDAMALEGNFSEILTEDWR